MIQLTDNLEINKPAPVDDRLGVFESTAEALAYIAEDRRYIGLTLIVDSGSGAEEYWFENGIQDGDLTAKSTGGGGATWGTITGTLSNQTDLQNALNAKVPYTGATQNADLGEYQMKAGQYEFDQTPTQSAGVAKLRWNDTDGTLDLGLKGGNVNLQIGQEQVIRVVNGTGSNLLEANYQAVRITGAQGQRLQVLLAQANNDANSADTIGLVTETINNNQEGFVTISGMVNSINTTGSLQGETWNDGDVLYLSGTTAGAITNVKPTAPIHIVVVGYVVYAHQNNGKIFVKVNNGYELDELHNVYINPATLANNDALIYDSTAQLWENTPLTKSLVGLGNVDNTSDANKPISSATQTALNAKQDSLGFTAENVANKVSNLTASATNYPTVNAVNAGLITRSYSVGTFGSSSITIASTGVANLVTVSGHAFTINEADMPIGTTIQVNGVVERTTGTTGNCGISYDVNGVKRYYIINAVTNAHQLQYQFTLYRESSTSIRLIGGSSATPIAMTFGAGNVGTTTATVTSGGNIVFQLSGWGTVVSDVFAFRFFKAILTR